MFVECPECGARKYTFEPPPSGKEYRCGKCETKFIFLPTVDESERETRKNWMVLGWDKAAQRAISIAVIALLLILAGGSSFAIAQPKHIVATSFKDAAITVLETSSESIGLIENIRLVVATYERNIVSTALQSMRAIEGLNEVPPVTVPTNDMARFPSAEYPLFPEYVEKRLSQFKYAVDSNGIVSIDPSDATTDALLEKIEQLLDQ